MTERARPGSRACARPGAPVRWTRGALRGLSLALVWCAAGCAAAKPLMVLRVPVADLRREPAAAARPGVHDPFEETQLLYGERVRRLKDRDGWAYVEAVEQPEYTHRRRWQGYPGWVPVEALAPAPTEQLSTPNLVVTAKWAAVWHDAYRTVALPYHLPLGTHLKGTAVGGLLWKVELLDRSFGWIRREDASALSLLQQLPKEQTRRLILSAAAKFLGDPYYWGGRSPHWEQPPGADPEQVTGVDCSGLVNLAYRAVGLHVPRDAHEQFLRATAVTLPQPADLIFLSAPGDPNRIVHVMLYAGDGQIIEGPGTGLAVRRLALEARLGRPLDELAPRTVIDEQTVFFGSYLP